MHSAQTNIKDQAGKVLSPEAAIGLIRRGDAIFISSGCAEPQSLTRALASQAHRFADNQIIHLLTVGHGPTFGAECQDRLRLNTCFLASRSRDLVKRGLADYTPVYLSELPRLIREGVIRVDVAMIQVSPPDRQGNCSLGISVEVTHAALEKARCVIAQVNPRMPRTRGQTRVHLDRLDVLVPWEEALIELPPKPPDETAQQIGAHVFKLVNDGDTIQLGIGRTISALTPLLLGRRDLGVHTEMFSDAMLDLVDAGAVTNARKSLHPGKVVASFCVGSSRLYERLHDNPHFEFHPVDYVADPFVVARHDNLVAINSALQVDLTGQVCVDSLGHHFFSGIGSQVDFIRGAARARNGRAVIALPSTARSGSVSRIVSALAPGAGVGTTRADVHYVVTEYGIANLRGRRIRERALALIEIAHPRFRQALLAEAKKLHYLYSDQEISPRQAQPDFDLWIRHLRMADGSLYTIRLIRPSDETRLQKLLYSLSAEDVRLRFSRVAMNFPHSQTQPLVVVDYLERVAFVAMAGSPHDDLMLGIGQYFLDRATNRAEVAFVVHEQWRRRGIASHLLAALTDYALAQRIEGFHAEIRFENRPMMRVFDKCGHRIHSRREGGTYAIWYSFHDTPEGGRAGTDKTA